MSGSNHKVNYFGSFLDVMNTPRENRPTTEQPKPKRTAADEVLRALLKRDGHVEVKDLLPYTEFSVDQLIQTLGTLESFDLVKRDGNVVTLTQSGFSTATKMEAG